MDADDARPEFERLLTPILGLAYGFAVRLTRNPADAEELVQEASLLAWRGFDGFERGSNFKAWFFRILTNAFYSTRRRTKREVKTVELDEGPAGYLFGRTEAAGLHEQTDDPARLLLSKLEGEAIAAALDRLPLEYRTVATLYFIDDLSYQEIADTICCPVGTVRSRLHRGRRILQTALWAIAEERGIVAELTPRLSRSTP